MLNPHTVVASLLVLALAAAGRPDELELLDGDRLVLVGNTFIERDQAHGYLETLLTTRHPDRTVTFRNLGWSGDTVFGHARAGFGSTPDGFQRLKEQIEAAEPTIVFVGYGSNEAFDGKSELPAFAEGLGRLLDVIEHTGARIVLLSPTAQELKPPPLPVPHPRNHDLRMYSNAMARIARDRGHAFVDLLMLTQQGSEARPLTDNGIHLTAYGYWRAGQAIEQALGFPPEGRRWAVEMSHDAQVTASEGTRVTRPEALADGLCFDAIDRMLPVPPAPRPVEEPQADRVLRVTGLNPGRYELMIDGKPIARATAAQWSSGVRLSGGPQFDQVEALRRTIVNKNRLYFYRWRPQNETYLFGFRKHEQGQNAAEVNRFDPLIAVEEERIAGLRAPALHHYELTREEETDR